MWTDVRRLQPMLVALVVVASFARALSFLGAWLGGRLPWQQSIWGFQVADVRGNQLAIAFTYGACDHYAGIGVTETAARVTVRVRGHNSSGACDSSAAVSCRRIVLRAPLGERELFDGSQIIPSNGPLVGPLAPDLTWCNLDSAS